MANPTQHPMGLVPVGGVVAWLKSLTGTPMLAGEYVECNGQALSDAQSDYNGNLIPNLNGASAGVQRFLRGSATSGTIAQNEAHSHGEYLYTSSTGANAINLKAGTTPVTAGTIAALNLDVLVQNASSLPSYYEVVWVMRIK